MTLVCKKAEYQNDKTLISPAIYWQTALGSTASAWCAQGRKRHLLSQGQGRCLGQLQGAAWRLYSVTVAFLYSHTTTMQEFFQDTAHASFSCWWKVSTVTASICPSLPGADSKLQEAAQVRQSPEQWLLKAEPVKPRSNLGNFVTVKNRSIWSLNHYLQEPNCGTLKTSYNKMNQVLTINSLNTKVRLLKYGKISLNAFLTHKLLWTCF